MDEAQQVLQVVSDEPGKELSEQKQRIWMKWKKADTAGKIQPY